MNKAGYTIQSIYPMQITPQSNSTLYNKALALFQGLQNGSFPKATVPSGMEEIIAGAFPPYSTLVSRAYAAPLNYMLNTESVGGGTFIPLAQLAYERGGRLVPKGEGGLGDAIRHASTIGQKFTAALGAVPELAREAASGIVHPIRAAQDTFNEGREQVKEGWNNNSMKGVMGGLGKMAKGYVKAVGNLTVASPFNALYGIATGDKPHSAGTYDEYVNGPQQPATTPNPVQPAKPTPPPMMPVETPDVDYQLPKDTFTPEGPDEVELGEEANVNVPQVGHALNRRQARRTAAGKKVSLGGGNGRQQLQSWEGTGYQNVGRRGRVQNFNTEGIGLNTNFYDKNGDITAQINKQYAYGGKFPVFIR